MIRRALADAAAAFMRTAVLGPWQHAVAWVASLPPALNVFVMASQYRVYVERASSAILIGTLASVATVTGLLWLISNDLLPVSLLAR